MPEVTGLPSGPVTLIDALFVELGAIASCVSARPRFCPAVPLNVKYPFCPGTRTGLVKPRLRALKTLPTWARDPSH